MRVAARIYIKAKNATLVRSVRIPVLSGRRESITLFPLESRKLRRSKVGVSKRRAILSILTRFALQSCELSRSEIGILKSVAFVTLVARYALDGGNLLRCQIIKVQPVAFISLRAFQCLCMPMV